METPVITYLKNLSHRNKFPHDMLHAFSAALGLTDKKGAVDKTVTAENIYKKINDKGSDGPTDAEFIERLFDDKNSDAFLDAIPLDIVSEIIQKASGLHEAARERIAALKQRIGERVKDRPAIDVACDLPSYKGIITDNDVKREVLDKAHAFKNSAEKIADADALKAYKAEPISGSTAAGSVNADINAVTGNLGKIYGPDAMAAFQAYRDGVKSKHPFLDSVTGVGLTAFHEKTVTALRNVHGVTEEESAEASATRNLPKPEQDAMSVYVKQTVRATASAAGKTLVLATVSKFCPPLAAGIGVVMGAQSIISGIKSAKSKAAKLKAEGKGGFLEYAKLAAGVVTNTALTVAPYAAAAVPGLGQVMPIALGLRKFQTECQKLDKLGVGGIKKFLAAGITAAVTGLTSFGVRQAAGGILDDVQDKISDATNTDGKFGYDNLADLGKEITDKVPALSAVGNFLGFDKLAEADRAEHQEYESDKTEAQNLRKEAAMRAQRQEDYNELQAKRAAESQKPDTEQLPTDQTPTAGAEQPTQSGNADVDNLMGKNVGDVLENGYTVRQGDLNWRDAYLRSPEEARAMRLADIERENTIDQAVAEVQKTVELKDGDYDLMRGMIKPGNNPQMAAMFDEAIDKLENQQQNGGREV